MSIQIEFEGYINGVRLFDWGNVYDVSHTQWGKDAKGEWEKKGADYFNVIGPAGEPVAEGSKILVKGRMKSKRYEKRDGNPGMSLEVRAETIAVTREPNESGAPSAAPAVGATPDMGAIWPDVQQVPDDAPF